MNFFYANGTPIINSLKVTSEVPLDPRLTVENIAERDSLVTNHISYDRMKVYVKSNDTKYIYHKDTGEWEIDNKFSEEDKSKLDRIDNYLIDTEHIYNPENKLLYREHSYDPNTDITTLRDHILQEARVSENGELYNGLLSKFYVNRLNNITNYLIDVSFTKGTDVPNLYLTTHSYNPDEDKTTLTNIDIPLATDDNHGLLSNLQNIKVNRIVDYVNRIDTTHTNAPDTGLTYNYNIYNPFTNANVTKTILIPLVTHTENGLTSSSDKIKIDDIETYVKSIALRQASGTEELGINYIITNPNDQTDTPGYFNIPLVTDSRNGLVSPARKHWMDNASGVSNTGTASDTWQLDKKDINTRLDPNGGVIIKDSGGIAEIRNNTDSAYSDLTLNNITIKGDVTQEGRSFITEAETVEVRDNTLLLNRGETGAGVSKEFAGIEIDRGSEPKYQILFDESDDRFKVGKEGDLWCVTLRDDEADMVNGMFTTWDSSTKRLKTTNIVPSDQKLSFGDNGDIELKYSLSKMGEIFSSAIPILNIGRKSSGYPHIEFGLSSSYAVVYTDALNGIYLQNQVLGRTFKRATDLSEVLYHADIVNNLTSGGTNKVLSAEQGKLLQNSITSIQGSYLPLSGGTMKGGIRFPVGRGIVCEDVSGSAAYGVLRTWNFNNSTRMYVGTVNFPTYISSMASDLIHDRNGSSYKIWDAYNLPTPASTTDLANYLPLAGGTLTGQLTIKQSIDIKLRLQSTDADNYCIIQAINSQASQLGVFGYAGDKWAIGHDGTYYEIWDKYNLTNPVTYTTNTYNHATLTNKDGQYFTYIKAGTNGLLPHSKATLVSGGSGFLGTSDQSFNAAYINNLHTNKVTFGVTGPYIIGRTSAIQFLNAEGGAQKVATGGLYVGPSYASDALSLVPANGIYSRGIIYIENGIGFRNSIWTNDLAPNRNYSGYLQVLDAYDASSAGGPTNYGTVLQVNSRNAHWANQLWFSGGAGASKNDLYYRHMAYNETTYGNWIKLATTSDLGNYLPLTGGTLSGNLTINTVGSTTLVINNNDTNGSETFMRVLRKGTASAAIGFRDSLGAYIYNYNSNKYLFIDNDGYVRVGTTSGSTRLALITDIPTVSGYLPLTGGTLTGTLSINSGGSEPLIINNSASAGEAYVVTKTQGTTRGVMGWNSSLGMFLQDNRGYTFSVKADGVYFGASSSTLTKLPTSTDLSNYLPLTGGNLTGKLSIKSSGPNLLILDSSSSTESVIHFLRSSTKKGAVGYYNNIGAFIYNFPSNTYLFVKDDGKPYVGTKTNYKKILTETDITGYATQSWVNNQGYLTSHQTIYNLTFQAGTFAAKTFDPNGAAATVNIPTNTSHLTNDSGFITSSALNGYATQSWANGQFAPLSRFNTSTGYTTIKVTGQEFNFDSANPEIYMNYRTLSGSTAVTKITWKGGSNSTLCEGRWGNLYMNDNLVATQSWAAEKFPNKTGTGASGTWGISITGNAATATTATKWNGYSIWTGTEDELPSSRDANTLYFVKKSS